MKKAKGIISTPKIIMLGVLFGLAFGFIDAVVDVIFFTDHTFLEHIFSPSPIEIWMRASVLLLFILFSVYISRIISKLRRAEEANKESEERYKALSDATFEGICISEKGVIVDTNQQFAEMLGYQQAELIGMEIKNLTTPEYREVVARNIKDDYTGVYESKTIKKDGVIIDVEIHGQRSIYKGRPVRETAIRDITERKRAEEKLITHAAIFANMTEGIYMISMDDFIIKWVNPVFEIMFGYDKGALIGKKVDIVNAPTEMTPEETRKFIVRILEETGQWHGEVENIKKDGTHFWCHANVFLFDHPEFGKTIVAVHNDITEHKRAEQALEQKARHIQQILDALPCFAMILTSNREVVASNKIARDGGAYPGKQCYSTLGKSDKPCPWCRAPAMLESGEFQHEQTWGRGIYWDAYWIPLEKDLYLHFAFDITERKRVEEKILKSEEQLRKAQEIAGIGFWDLDLITGELYWSDVIYGMLGFKVNEVVPNYELFKDRVHPDDRERVQQHVDAALNDDIPYNVDFRYLFPTGEIRYVNPQAEVTRDEFGKAIRLFGTQQDITERKLAEEELERTRDRLQLLFEGISDAIFVHEFRRDVSPGNFIEVNEAACERLGYTREELLQMSLLDIDAPDSGVDLSGIIKQIFDGKSVVFEQVHVSKDGTHIPVEINARGFELEGTPAVMSIVRDITKRKQMEDELKSIMALSKDMICTASATHFIKVSPVMEKVLGYTEEELLQTPFVELIHPDDIQPTKDLIEEKLKKGEPAISFTNRYRHKDGSYLWLEWMSKPLEGGLMHGVARDITERKRAEEELKQALDDKDMLMREVHHRVKNNLTVIQSLLSLQVRDITDDKSKGYFADAQNRVRSMTMIHEILHSSDNLRRMKTKDYIEKLVGTLFDNYKSDAQAIKLHYEIEDIILDVDTMIPLGLIINELVTNALKYAFPGDAAGVLRISLHNTGGMSYELIVKDTGVGLPEDFDLGEADSLGLLIIKSLVSQIHGDLEVLNKNGSEFRISFAEKTLV